MSVWMGAVQLSGRPCQSRATAQSRPPCPPPLGNPCHQPGPLTSPVHWLWGLDSPPPESNPAPSPHPSSRPPSCTPAPPSPPSRRSARPSHTAILSGPGLSPPPPPGAPRPQALLSRLCLFHPPGVLGHSAHGLCTAGSLGTLRSQGGGLLLCPTASGVGRGKAPLGPEPPLASLTA